MFFYLIHSFIKNLDYNVIILELANYKESTKDTITHNNDEIQNLTQTLEKLNQDHQALNDQLNQALAEKQELENAKSGANEVLASKDVEITELTTKLEELKQQYEGSAEMLQVLR